MNTKQNNQNMFENPLDIKNYNKNKEIRSLCNSRLSNKSGMDYAKSILAGSSDSNALKSIASSKYSRCLSVQSKKS